MVVAMTEDQEEEIEKQIFSEDEELVNVDGTKVKLSGKLVKHAEEIKRRSLVLKGSNFILLILFCLFPLHFTMDWITLIYLHSAQGSHVGSKEKASRYSDALRLPEQTHGQNGQSTKNRSCRHAIHHVGRNLK